MGLGSAQEQPAETASSARLTIQLDARGAASVQLTVFERQLSSSLTSVMSQVIGCEFHSVREHEAEGDWIFSDRCANAFLKRGLLIGGTIELSPLMNVLREARVALLSVTIRHPRAGFSQFTEKGWNVETSPQSLEYSRTIPTYGPPESVRLAFGYRILNFLPVTLLLFPIGLTLLMRWAALRVRNIEPTIVWFTYWRLFGCVITGAWLLWIQGSTVLDCAALARFLTNGSPKSGLLQVSFYLVPPILVQFICTLASGAVLARISGDRWLLPVTLKHAFWHEPVTIWPLLCLLAGIASLALFNQFVLGFMCLAVAYVSQVVLVRLWLHFQNLNRYELPEGDLRTRILALAQKAEVNLKRIYLLPAAEGRLAAPFMSKAGRLLLSDYLVRSLSCAELEAVLARELIHMKRRHRALMLAATVLVLPLIYRFSHLSIIASTLPWAVRGPLLVWLSPILLYLLWRHLERRADAEATDIAGDATVLKTGVSKVWHCNLIGLYWRKIEGRFFPNSTSVREWPETVTVTLEPSETVLVTRSTSAQETRVPGA